MRFSCERCRNLHRKCDRSDPCRNCVKAEVTCEYAEPKSRKRKLAARDDGRSEKKRTQAGNVHVLQRNSAGSETSLSSSPPASPCQTMERLHIGSLHIEGMKSANTSIISKGTKVHYC